MDKKIINRADDAVEEFLDGFVAANARYYERVDGVKGLRYKNRRLGKVSLIVGGGSGHEPLFAGFVGRGLADAAACGNIFASPDPFTIYEVAKSVDGSEGILFLYGNYAGDNLNFDMAEEMLGDEGIKTAHYRVKDDCASAPPERRNDRRGVSGNYYAIKIAGAACDAGLSLEEVSALCGKLNTHLCSFGLATSPGQIPGSESPAFTIGDDEIEFGIGIHGERGVLRTDMRQADELVETICSKIMEDMPLVEGDEVCVLINGMGSTTLMELGIVFRKVNEILGEKGVVIYDSTLGSHCTCMEMGGFFITVLKLDYELKKYYDTGFFTPYIAREEF